MQKACQAGGPSEQELRCISCDGRQLWNLSAKPGAASLGFSATLQWPEEGSRPAFSLQRRQEDIILKLLFFLDGNSTLPQYRRKHVCFEVSEQELDWEGFIQLLP